jgi:hypothetical protein
MQHGDIGDLTSILRDDLSNRAADETLWIQTYHSRSTIYKLRMTYNLVLINTPFQRSPFQYSKPGKLGEET